MSVNVNYRFCTGILENNLSFVLNFLCYQRCNEDISKSIVAAMVFAGVMFVLFLFFLVFLCGTPAMSLT